MDRNDTDRYGLVYDRMVALRKESVDRNAAGNKAGAEAFKSLSARRAWIEMLLLVPVLDPLCVALRKESVDRNVHVRNRQLGALRRSPQGERG